MNLDDLRAEWRAEMQRPDPATDRGLEGIKRQVTELRRGIRFGSFWIVFAFVSVSVIEVLVQFVALEGAGWLSKLGAVAWVCLTIWLTMVLRQSATVVRSDDWTLRSRLEMEIEHAQKHRDTWSKVATWYLAPIMSVVVLSMLGGSHDKTGSYAPGPVGWALLATCAAMYVFTYWFCRREIRTTVDPLLGRLKELHSELTGGESIASDNAEV